MEAVAAASTPGHFVAQPFRPQFLQTPGKPPIPWDRWKRLFDDWLLAIGFPDTEAFAARKAAILRASLGPEGSRIYYSLAPKTTVEDFTAVANRMQTYFGTTASDIYNRAQFTRHQQRPGETIAQFISTLRELAAKCNFPDSQVDERVRDQFAACCADNRIRERLLQEPGTKTLADLELLALTMERALQEAPALATSSTAVASAPVGSVGNRKSASSSPTCGNCGRAGHASRAANCPARDKDCSKCGKTGHFGSVCRSSGAKTTSGRSSHQSGAKFKRSQTPNRKSAKTNNIDADNDVVSTLTVVSSVQSTSPGTFKYVNCTLNGVATTLLLDLGAKVSIISNAFRLAHLSSVAMTPSPLTLGVYGGGSVSCIGRVQLTVQLVHRQPLLFSFEVSERGHSLMGVDLFDALGGAVLLGDDRFVTAPVMSSTPVVTSSVKLTDYPVLLKSSGTLKGFVHRPMIDTSVKPVQQKFWHPPQSLREPISAELRRMEAEGVIEKIDASPWTSNIVTARKRDGSLRICVNLTAVNKAIISERFPLPTMEELTAKVAGSTYFSKIDLLWGYLQLPLAEDRKYLTAFVTHDAVWQYKSLPFGLASGPSAFQQVIRKILHGLDGCVNILDDILVYGRTMEEHDTCLRRVLARLAAHNATVRQDKCVIGATEVEFNGHRISASGVLPLRSNVASIQNMSVPTNARQLVRFLATASYYMKFVAGFADLCEPLRQLTKADAVWNWSSTCQQAFDEIKRRIASPPVLAHFDSSLPPVVTCDASSVALGACLSQWQGGVERPIAFISRTLTPAERKYSATERESLACLWACERLHYFLYGRRFHLVTDHQALKTLLSSGGTGHRPLRLHRWADRLFQYNFEVVFRPGKRNVVADCLSRAFDEPTDAAAADASVASDNDDDSDDVNMVQSIFGNLSTSVVPLDAVVNATGMDPVLQRVRHYIINGWPTAKSDVESEVRAFYDLQHELSVVCDGRCILRGCRVVVPPPLRLQLLDLAHEGHPGIARMKGKCRETIWWPGIDADVERHVTDCTACVISGKSVRPSPGPLQPVKLPTGPWRKLSLDIAGEFMAAPRQHRFMLVAIDYYSKWPEAVTCESVTSSTVISFLTQLFDRFGLVEEIVTDNGTQFTSVEFESFLSSLSIRHSRSALYAPETNAEVERFNRVMKDGLRTGLADGKAFTTAVRQTLAAYRTTPCTTTGVTPASLMLSFPVRTPLSLLQQQAGVPVATSASAARQTVERRVEFNQKRMADQHDKRQNAKQPRFKAGDVIRVKLPNRPHKLSPAYSEPFPVVRAAGNTVWLANGQRWNVRRCILVRPTRRPSSPPVPPPSADGTGSTTANDDIDDDDGAQFVFRLPSADNRPTPTPRLPPAPPLQPAPIATHAGNNLPRRSTRHRVQREFGPVVSH
jgi:hypothetical protein